MNKDRLIANGFKCISEYFPNIKDNYWINNKGDVYSFNKNGLMSNRLDHYGYRTNGFSQNDNSCKYLKIHMLVNHIFNGIPPKDMISPVTDHIDDNPLNNYYKNLRWLPLKENAFHKNRHTGQISDLNDEDIPKLFKDYENGLKIKELSVKYKISKRYVCQLLAGEVRRYALKLYNLKPRTKQIQSKPIDLHKLWELSFMLISDNKPSDHKISKILDIGENVVTGVRNKVRFVNDTKDFNFINKTTSLFNNMPPISIINDQIKIGNTTYYN